MAGRSSGTSRQLARPRRRVLMALGYYDWQVHRGILRYAREVGWILDTSMAHYGVIPVHWQGDGVMTALMPERADLTRFIRRKTVPVVALSSDVPDVKVTRIVSDDRSIGRLAAEHLLQRGFTDLGFYKCTDADAAQDREAGFRDAVQQAGRNYHFLDWHAASRRKRNLNPFDWIKRQVAGLPLPIGMMAQSDLRASYLINACEALGLAVPEQVAVIGVDNDTATCELAPVPISSVDYARETLAYEGAKLLDRLMNGEPPPATPILVAPRGIVVRRSSEVYRVSDPAVARALAFIREHYREPIGVPQVVHASLTSRCGLYRAFWKHVKRSVGAEIDRHRVEHAMRLLAQPDEKLYRIARECGFSDSDHFTRVFRRMTGLTPSVYRRSHP